jgi:uncharacterized RDD family membrane protein YckC
MPTGFDLLESSGDFRRHWLKRIGASLIDAVIVFTPISLAMIQTPSTEHLSAAGLFSGIGLFAYSFLLEGFFGQTLGKLIMHLRVTSLGTGKFRHVFIRSVPKMFWYIFLPFDALAGLATAGDPRQRWTDHIAKTTVVAYDPAAEKLKRQSEPDRGAKKQMKLAGKAGKNKEKAKEKQDAPGPQ